MLSENEPKSTRIENRPVLLIVGILVSACAISVLLLNWQKEPQFTPQQEIPAMLIPTATMPTAMQASYFSIRLPIILSVSVSGSEQIWKVTNINSLGYELGGQSYDLATFTQIDGQDTVQGYCINRGWNVPNLGTEYLLNAGGIFVPMYEPDADPFQRFLMIQ